ncbi:hypothetical protein V4F39_02090 [Aquincola sp. MAHUQ-54]|uniref:Uncharacterized protein n=1 Tax=Aquincola agrisoli TaxID=3119538 RepID=A0AAW9Q7P3_9BURK
MIIAIWIVTAVLLGLWSLTAWGLHVLLVHGAGWAADLRPLIEQIPFGEWIDRWVPGWQAMLQLALDLVQAGLGWLGASAGFVVWLVWGLGAAALAGMAGLGTLMVVLLRGKPQPPSVPA